MKYVRFSHNGDISWGVKQGERIIKLDDAPYHGGKMVGELFDQDTVTLLAPCEPSKIVAIGKNYYEHALEFDGTVPSTPILFMMGSNSVNNPFGEILYPDFTERLDFEGELAFIISKTAKNVKAEDYKDYILGYTILNDVTCRDIQFTDGQWTRAKCVDGHAPIGPCVVANMDASALTITTRVNGEVKQNSNTSKLMTKIPEILAFITKSITLNAGDVVATGTPEGVSPMVVGDIVEVEIEGIGILQNTVAKAK